MNEKDYALQLKQEYEDAKLTFNWFVIARDFDIIQKQYNLNFDTLKTEVKKLGYKLELAKNIKTKYWQKEAKKSNFFVFYLNDEDL